MFWIIRNAWGDDARTVWLFLSERFFLKECTEPLVNHHLNFKIVALQCIVKHGFMNTRSNNKNKPHLFPKEEFFQFL